MSLVFMVFVFSIVYCVVWGIKLSSLNTFNFPVNRFIGSLYQWRRIRAYINEPAQIFAPSYFALHMEDSNIALVTHESTISIISFYHLFCVPY